LRAEAKAGDKLRNWGIKKLMNTGIQILFLAG
jgi:hypothetical protein